MHLRCQERAGGRRKWGGGWIEGVGERKSEGTEVGRAGEREDGARLDLGHGGGEERGREVEMESPGSDG